MYDDCMLRYDLGGSVLKGAETLINMELYMHSPSQIA